MTNRDWTGVLDQAAELRVEMVQFIGGEPTPYPGFLTLLNQALALGSQGGVYQPGARHRRDVGGVLPVWGVAGHQLLLRRSAQHAAITGRPSHGRTRSNIAEALRRGIPLRVGVIDLGDGQHAEAARTDLIDLGVPAIGYDRLRQVGRGVRDGQAGAAQLCGRCGDGVAAISPDGSVWPCVFSRWLLLQPTMAERVRAELVAMLESRDGLISQLYVTAHMLLRINDGDYVDLAIPLHRNADRVIDLLRPGL